jgi:hypothetical protein
VTDLNRLEERKAACGAGKLDAGLGACDQAEPDLRLKGIDRAEEHRY